MTETFYKCKSTYFKGDTVIIPASNDQEAIKRASGIFCGEDEKDITVVKAYKSIADWLSDNNQEGESK